MDKNDEDKELQPIFLRFAEYGITQGEICGAIECLKRENDGRMPTAKQVCIFISNYIQWRSMEQGRARGELWYVAQLTEKGQQALALGKKVDAVFSEYFKPKGG